MPVSSTPCGTLVGAAPGRVARQATGDIADGGFSGDKVLRQEKAKLHRNRTVGDPWTGTVELLLGVSRPSIVSRCIARPVPWAGCMTSAQRKESAQTLTTAIRAIDRLTDCTVAIAWSDATRGAYGDQVWRRMRARCRGMCAISGAAIAHGDAIYSPRPSRLPCANADAMVLASVIDAVALKVD
jgi:hypothetical protein